jgi:putative tryptophan/tyrosine transport system substrate-binding protein
MRRRDFITLLGCGPVVWPFTAQSGPIPHIAYLGALSPSTLDPRQIEQFKFGLTENGLIEGQNIQVDYLWGEGKSDRLRQLATELAESKLDVIVTAGPQPLRALGDAGVTSPIVFAILNDPVGDGFVQSLAHPGGNITGLSMAGTDLESKRLEILKEAVPTLKKVMLLHDPSMGSTGLVEAKAGAQRLALEAFVVESGDPEKIKNAFAVAATQGVSGVATMASPFFNFHRKQLIELASQHRLPSIWEGGAYVRDGGLLAYGPSFPDMYRRSAGYVAKIINGAKPSDLPIEQPIRFELAVNTKTAQALGLVVPPRLISRADEVIE